ncbi:hypothetical protein WH87_09725 [Devosia epidermidihirudinis]|uniref:HTH LytTR-type domain-containing protein n=1 Tax=Devosia epidermidihirudinis TaxID=1293439 RepID=A0A0F5QD49_9HYPH|nr:LytTR family DNA-binding domain-containing protein [Devosia epidermidihirudinis]KKC37929.1 hypothetical protein WH87_09725 [Devosia epidermidihirudinis]
MQAVFTSPRTLVSMAAAVLLLGLSGPFGTLESFDAATRLVYWLAVVVLSYTLSRAVAVAAMTSLAPRITQLPLRVTLSAFIASLPATIVVALVSLVAYSSGDQPSLVRLWLYCLAVALALVSVIAVTERSAPVAELALPAAPVQAAILQRLPLPARGKLSHISVQDHYVDVVTDRGRALILLRLSDAMRETEGVPGLQIHRSHWVALDAVRKPLKIDGKPMVELADGTRLPISRSFLPEARAAGLVS